MASGWHYAGENIAEGIQNYRDADALSGLIDVLAPKQSDVPPALPQAPAPQAAAAPPQAAPTPADQNFDLAARTIIGEAGNQGPQGMAAVAHVIKNRSDQSGLAPGQVVLAPGQFEPWNNPQTRAKLAAIDPNSPEYQQALAIVKATWGGQLPDPTGGATHFFAPKAQAALGRDVPAWAQGQPGQDIGDQRFYNLGYSAPGGAQQQDQSQGQPQTQQPVLGRTNELNPQVAEKLKAMIHAGGGAREYALAIIGKYIGKQDPVKVGEGESLVTPTGQVIFRAGGKPQAIREGGALIQDGKLVYQAPDKPQQIAPGGTLVQGGRPVFQAPDRPQAVSPGTTLFQGGAPIYQAPEKPEIVAPGSTVVRAGQPEFQAPNAPQVVGPGAAVVQGGQPLYQAADRPQVVPMGASVVQGDKVVVKPTNDGIIDADTVTDMARQYRAGDTSVMQNIGRGAQGAENIKALRAEIVRQNRSEGRSPEEQASVNAEYMGLKSGQRTLGTKNANIEMAATEFKQVLPVVQQASAAVSRTNYPDLNKVIQAYEERTGDPKIVAFGGGVNTLVNLYARAISPNGTGTVSDKEHAREILTKAWSQGQFDAAVGMMQQEIDAALSSPEKVRQQMRERFLGGTKGGAAPASGAPSPTPAPANGSATPALPTFATPQDVYAAMRKGALKSGDPFMTPDGQTRFAK